MTEKFPIAADQLRAMTEPSADTISQHIGWLKQYIIGMTDANWADMRVRAERQLHELSAALRAQSDVRAPVPQGKPAATACCKGLAPISECQCEIDRSAMSSSAADLAEDCAKIAEGHVGAEGPYSSSYDRACRDIAKAIRDTHIVEGAGK